MKKQLTLAFLVLACIFAQTKTYAQNPLVKQWDYRFGGTNDDIIHFFQQTTDGGYILGGSSLSDSSGDKTQALWGYVDYWIVKIDSIGNKMWDKDFGGTFNNQFSLLEQTSDGGFILGGFSNSDSGGDKTQDTWGSDDFWIVKIDSLGNKQWDKDFGGTNSEWLESLQQTADNGYIFGGWSNSGIGGDKTQANWDTICIPYCTDDYWIIKTDSLGNKQWDKTFGGSSSDELLSVKQTTDGGYILGGFSWSDSSGDKTQKSWGEWDYWIIKIDSLGSKQWDRDFGGIASDALWSLQQTTDGGYILGGYSWSGISGDKTQPLWGGTGDIDYWIIKTDSLGNKQWDKDFGGTNFEDAVGTISQTYDGGYLIAGTSYSNISGDKTENNLAVEQVWTLKIDSLGIKQWDKTLRTNAATDDETGYAIQTKDGCYAMTNYTDAGIGGDKTQPSQGGHDYWIIKFCDTTSASLIAQTSIYPLLFYIQPNPVFGSGIHLSYLLPRNKSGLFQMYDVTGKIVFQHVLPEQSNEQSFSLPELSDGVYNCVITSDHQRASKKLAVIKKQ